MKVKWVSLDNRSGTASLRQHAFIATFKSKRPYNNREYTGNISLCGKISVDNGNEEMEDFNRIEADVRVEVGCCKICYRKASQLDKNQ